MTEMRKHPRFQSKQLVRFRDEGGEEIPSISKIINVSQGGLQFACRDLINVDRVLVLDVPGPDAGKTVSLKARVIWTNSTPDANGLYYSGAAFVDIREDARALVLKAIL